VGRRSLLLLHALFRTGGGHRQKRGRATKLLVEDCKRKTLGSLPRSIVGEKTIPGERNLGTEENLAHSPRRLGAVLQQGKELKSKEKEEGPPLKGPLIWSEIIRD